MKKLLVIIATSLSMGLLHAQDEKPFNFKPYGFVRNYFYYDTRQTINSNNGLYNQIPKDEDIDKISGDDLNDIPSSSFFAFTTRLGLDIRGPQVLGAASSAKIETDFAGFSSSTTMLRIRQAYMNLGWNHHNLLLGQTWHPMSNDLPDVLGLASGSPFQPFSRTPQVRYTYQYQGFRTIAAALWQFQYLSVGPDGTSINYSKNAILPEMFLAVEYTTSFGLKVGAGVDYSRLKPRVTTEATTTKVTDEGQDTVIKYKKKVDEYVDGISPVFYFKYNRGKFKVQGKSVYGQNTSHLNMMSGYGVSKINDNGSYEYTPLQNSTSYIDFSYGSTYKVNLFLGYSKNLGTTKDVVKENLLYVRGAKNIDQMYRVSPAVSYNLKHFNFGIEYEWTAVDYGKVIGKKCKVSDTHTVDDHRICGMIKYNF